MSFLPTEPSLPHTDLSDIDEDFELLDVCDPKNPNPNPNPPMTEPNPEPETETNANPTVYPPPYLDFNYIESDFFSQYTTEFPENGFPVIDFTTYDDDDDNNKEVEIPGQLDASYIERLRALKAERGTPTSTEMGTTQTETDTTTETETIFSPSPRASFTHPPFIFTQSDMFINPVGIPTRPIGPFRFGMQCHPSFMPHLRGFVKPDNSDSLPSASTNIAPLIATLNPAETLNETFAKLAPYFDSFIEEKEPAKQEAVVRALCKALATVSTKTKTGEIDFGDAKTADKVMAVVRLGALSLGFGERERALEERARGVDERVGELERRCRELREEVRREKSEEEEVVVKVVKVKESEEEEMLGWVSKSRESLEREIRCMMHKLNGKEIELARAKNTIDYMQGERNQWESERAEWKRKENDFQIALDRARGTRSSNFLWG
ncbi:hypothetical protein BO78DRAFT_413505 [Aspergillus sclerotiicarbonarius CBS 121057]|uniref:Uncharacterized protein n=1 Tax=Aspergillus sclerotiicarbonarius (strain CBS 121057 / IBT 28362) TaxID=1448318 RepID=A0A319EN99_ASPSB|nr:hypothetical protein BO78DRAFT_413505 [Aspergillus sclerotiicarbonarius CBS 121057]